MHLDRFTRGIEILREVAAQNKPYKHAVWFDNEDDPMDCGSSACAVGWMARDRWMQTQGLCTDVPNVCPMFGVLAAHEAIAAFFCIPIAFEEYLFAPWTYPVKLIADITAAMVVARMEAMLAKHRAMMHLGTPRMAVFA